MIHDGTDEMNLLRKCPCPVWLIKCGGSRSFRRILAAVDVGDSNRPGEETRHAMNCRILEVASALARSECAELHVAYARDAVGEAIMRGTTVNTPEKYVASMGTVGRTGIPGLLMGNTAETILQQVDCSVLAIKPPGFVTPVTLDA
ncbi:universal stress protein [Thiocapsa sp.]|uniref:universal stress protein n=2 Tax=Thiocapsa sp. TaxID=2024551 RepID=UPI001BCB4B61|nr:universal stress protein [Thiocapsa sp.]